MPLSERSHVEVLRLILQKFQILLEVVLAESARQ
jgi:hypothetical protein